MKNYILFCLSLLSITLYSQEIEDSYITTEEHHEIKINGLFLILGAFDDETINVNYYISPYYRQYFGKKYASGFFVEAFGMLNSVDDYIYDSYYDEPTDSYYSNSGYDDNVVDFALGIGLGGKWLTKSGFIVEIDLGIGRNLFKNDRDFTIIGKGGINLGYRF